MRIAIELTVPGTQFAPGRALGQLGGVQVTFMRTVAVSSDVFPYMWIRADDHTRVCQRLQADAAVAEVRMLHRDGDGGLYRATWQPGDVDFMSMVREQAPIVHRARGTRTEWKFELWFDSHEAVGAFQNACERRALGYSVQQVTTESVSDPLDDRLSDPQRETLLLAFEEGFFDVPRETTVLELADELGISDQAVSARLRRGIKRLIDVHEREHAPPRIPGR